MSLLHDCGCHKIGIWQWAASYGLELALCGKLLQIWAFEPQWTYLKPAVSIVGKDNDGNGGRVKTFEIAFMTDKQVIKFFKCERHFMARTGLAMPQKSIPRTLSKWRVRLSFKSSWSIIANSLAWIFVSLRYSAMD